MISSVFIRNFKYIQYKKKFIGNNDSEKNERKKNIVMKVTEDILKTLVNYDTI